MHEQFAFKTTPQQTTCMLPKGVHYKGVYTTVPSVSMMVTSNVSSSISLGASIPEDCSISCSVSPTSKAVLSGRTFIIAEKSLPLRLRFGSVNVMSFASEKQAKT